MTQTKQERLAAEEAAREEARLFSVTETDHSTPVPPSPDTVSAIVHDPQQGPIVTTVEVTPEQSESEAVQVSRETAREDIDHLREASASLKDQFAELDVPVPQIKVRGECYWWFDALGWTNTDFYPRRCTSYTELLDLYGDKQ